MLTRREYVDFSPVRNAGVSAARTTPTLHTLPPPRAVAWRPGVARRYVHMRLYMTRAHKLTTSFLGVRGEHRWLSSRRFMVE